MNTEAGNELAVAFEKVESATMKSGESAHIFYFDIRNKSPKRQRIYTLRPVYATRQNQELELDVWLSGLANGHEGFSLSSGAFKKIGLVFYKSNLPKLLAGEKLFLTAWAENSGKKTDLVFQSIEATVPQFDILSSLVLPLGDDELALGTKKSEITSLVERMEILEERAGISFQSIYAIYEKSLGEFAVKVNFDIVGPTPLANNVRPTVSLYNALGQLLDTRSTFIAQSDFIGIASFSIEMRCAQPPRKVRLFPSFN